MKTTASKAASQRRFLQRLVAPSEFPFPEMEAIQKLWAGDRSAKLENAVVKAAKKWLPYRVFWLSGRLPCAEMPIGTYALNYVIAFEMERHWNLPEFRDGLRFWLQSDADMDAAGNRDANPWEKISKDRARSWDCGYMLGHAWRYRRNIRY